MINCLNNKTKKKKIINRLKQAKSFAAKVKGLMFESKKNFDYALLFDFGHETRLGASIHMMFVFFSIDAVFLDSKRKVVDIARCLKPWALNYTPKRAARFLVELQAGKAKTIKLGDKLNWKTPKTKTPKHRCFYTCFTTK